MTTTPRTGFRLASTRLGDTVQSVAARELGDANRWPEIVAYNGLTPPYIVDSLAGVEEAGDAGTVILAGRRIKVPAGKSPIAVSDPLDPFGSDLLLDGGVLGATEAGDFALVSGVPNLRQALTIRLGTHVGELLYHQDYGNPLFDLVGRPNNPVDNQLAAAYAERTLRADPRVDRVEAVRAVFAGDATSIDAVAVATDGRSLPLEIP